MKIERADNAVTVTDDHGYQEFFSPYIADALIQLGVKAGLEAAAKSVCAECNEGRTAGWIGGKALHKRANANGTSIIQCEAQAIRSIDPTTVEVKV